MRKNHKIKPSTIEENYDRVYINRPDLPAGYHINPVFKTVYINMVVPITPEPREKRRRRR